VKTASAFKKSTTGLRNATLLALAAAIATLLLATSASAEVDGGSSLPPVGEAPAVVAEQAQPPASSTAPESDPVPEQPASAPAPELSDAAPEPAAAAEDISVSPSPEPPAPVSPSPEPPAPVSSSPEPPASAPSADNDPAAPAKSNGLASAAAIGNAVNRSAAAAESVTATGKEVQVPAIVEANGAELPVLQHRTSALVEDLDKGFAETTAPAVDQLPTAQIAPAVERLPSTRIASTFDRLPAPMVSALKSADLLLQPTNLLDSVVPAMANVPAPSPFQADRRSKPEEAVSFLPKMSSAGLFLQPDALASGPSTSAYMAPQPAGAEIPGEQALLSSSRMAMALSAAQALLGATLTRTAAHHLQGPAAPNLPLPAPGSPASAVPDAGGPSFVPIVALLALLALVAPAALRRLGGAADFRAPVPFVCALERPG
jgi:hypothetical protein